MPGNCDPSLKVVCCPSAAHFARTIEVQRFAPTLFSVNQAADDGLGPLKQSCSFKPNLGAVPAVLQGWGLTASDRYGSTGCPLHSAPNAKLGPPVLPV